MAWLFSKGESMFKYLAVLGVAVAVLVAGLTATPKISEAQVPYCIPITPFSTTCAPVQTIRVLCPDRFPSSVINPYFAGYSPANPYLVNYYGNQVPMLNSLYYGYNGPSVVTFENGVITNVRQLPDSGLCPTITALPLAAAPTPVPTQAPQIIYVQPPAPAVSQASSIRSVPPKVGIAPPRTGDAGLLIEE